MDELNFKMINEIDITKEHANAFLKLLIKQKKVQAPTEKRILACRQILFCIADKKIVGIGAIKPKTKSDFTAEKADLNNISKKFDWELGYLYVEENFRGLGISSTITRLLLIGKENENIMASTEIYKNNPMIKVLKKSGFKQYGKPWGSSQHDGTLGLFLKFKLGKSTTKV